MKKKQDTWDRKIRSFIPEIEGADSRRRRDTEKEVKRENMTSKTGSWNNRNIWDHKLRSFIPGNEGADLRREKEREKNIEKKRKRDYDRLV